MSGISNQIQYSQSIKAALQGLNDTTLGERLNLLNETELKTIQRAIGQGDTKPLNPMITKRVLDLLFLGKPIETTPAAVNPDGSWITHVKAREVYLQILRNKQLPRKNPSPVVRSPAPHDSSARVTTVQSKILAFKEEKARLEREKAPVDVELNSKEEALTSLEKDQKEIEKITCLEQGKELLENLKACLNKENALDAFAQAYQRCYTHKVFQEGPLKKILLTIGTVEFPNLVYGKKILKVRAEIEEQICELEAKIATKEKKKEKSHLIEALGVLKQLDTKCAELNNLSPDQIGASSVEELLRFYWSCVENKECFIESTKLNEKIVEIGALIKSLLSTVDQETKILSFKKKVKKLDKKLQTNLKDLEKLIQEKRQAHTNNNTVTKTYEKLKAEKKQLKNTANNLLSRIEVCDKQIRALEGNSAALKGEENLSSENKKKIAILETSLEVYHKLERVLLENPQGFTEVLKNYSKAPCFLGDDYKHLWDNLTQLLYDTKMLNKQQFIANQRQALNEQLTQLKGEVRAPSLVEALAQPAARKTLSEVIEDLKFHEEVDQVYRNIWLTRTTIWNNEGGGLSLIRLKINEIKNKLVTQDLPEKQRQYYLACLEELSSFAFMDVQEVQKKLGTLRQAIQSKIEILKEQKKQLRTLSGEEINTDRVLNDDSDSGSEGEGGSNGLNKKGKRIVAW